MTRKKADCILAAVLFCFALTIILYTEFKMVVPPVFVSFGIGPQTFPVLLSWVILVLSAALFVSAILKNDTSSAVSMSASEIKTIAIFILVYAAYILLMPIVGFFVMTTLFLIFIFLYLKVSVKYICILVPSILVLVYLVFTKVCLVFMPAGFLI